eukprot:gene45304-64674_t
MRRNGDYCPTVAVYPGWWCDGPTADAVLGWTFGASSRCFSADVVAAGSVWEVDAADDYDGPEQRTPWRCLAVQCADDCASYTLTVAGAECVDTLACAPLIKSEHSTPEYPPGFDGRWAGADGGAAAVACLPPSDVCGARSRGGVSCAGAAAAPSTTCT